MSTFVSMTKIMNIAINKYFELRQIYNKQINEIRIFVSDEIYNNKVCYANTINDWNDEK